MSRILVIKLGALGDFVLAFGPFAAIRAQHPDAEITLLTTPPFAEFARAAPWFDRVTTDTRPRPWQVPALLGLRRALLGFDRVYDLQTSGRSGWYFQLAGRPDWSGIAPGCSLPHANPARNAMHTVERQRDQLKMAGVTHFPPPDLNWLHPHPASKPSPSGRGQGEGLPPAEPTASWPHPHPDPLPEGEGASNAVLIPGEADWLHPHPPSKPSPSGRGQGEGLPPAEPTASWQHPHPDPLPEGEGASYAVLIPGAAAHRPRKRWPAARFGELAAILVGQGHTPVIVGAREDAAHAATIRAACPAAIDLTGRTTLLQLGAVLSRACLAVGNDTGPTHLAAALGVPTVALFSDDSDPALTRPRGAVTVLTASDLADLSVQRVAAALPQVHSQPSIPMEAS